jgi:hypothetical protein
MNLKSFLRNYQAIFPIYMIIPKFKKPKIPSAPSSFSWPGLGLLLPMGGTLLGESQLVISWVIKCLPLAQIATE